MMMHDACHAYIDGHRTRSVGIALGVPLPDPAYRMCFSMVTGGRARVVMVVVVRDGGWCGAQAGISFDQPRY